MRSLFAGSRLLRPQLLFHLLEAMYRGQGSVTYSQGHRETLGMSPPGTRTEETSQQGQGAHCGRSEAGLEAGSGLTFRQSSAGWFRARMTSSGAAPVQRASSNGGTTGSVESSASTPKYWG
jgi:hypothetical protein